MHTSTQRSTRTRKPAAAPLSATAAKLIEQIQAEARDKLLTELSAKYAIVVLQGIDAETKIVDSGCGRIEIYERKGNSISVYHCYQEPESWRNSEGMAGHWGPARWYGDQTMVDGTGAQWKRDLNVYICDDYGNLVQVAE